MASGDPWERADEGLAHGLGEQALAEGGQRGEAGRLHWGDALTGARLVAAPVFAWLLYSPRRAPCWATAALFAAVCLSDYFDGKLARRAQRPSARGRIADSFADIAFILSALAAGWSLGIVPWWVPAAVAVSFASYVADSLLLTRSAPRPTLLATRLGHWAGVANFAVVGLVAAHAACGPAVVGRGILDAVFWTVPAYSLAAVAARIQLWRRFPGGPARGSRSEVGLP